MMNKNVINVYWSTGSEKKLIRSPELVFNFLTKNKRKTVKNNIFACPASNNFFNNLFVIKSAVSDKHKWKDGYLRQINEDMENDEGNRHILINSESASFDISCTRKSALDNYIDVFHSIRVLFFADQPLIARFSAPNFPTTAPVNGALLMSGEFDIGQWLRPYNLNYFLPLDTTNFEIKKDDHLFYIQLLTDKKIEFHEFKLTEKIINISKRFMKSPIIDGGGKSLEERYKILSDIQPSSEVLLEIKKNVL